MRLGPWKVPRLSLVSVTPQDLPQGWPPLTSCTPVNCASLQSHKHQGSAYSADNSGLPPRTHTGCSHYHKGSASDTRFIYAPSTTL